jgi:hypothetical protein
MFKCMGDAVMALNESRKLLLDDGLYQVRLDPSSTRADDMANVYLERETLDGSCTRIGSAHLQANQQWMAAIATAESESFRIVGWTPDRRDAIVTLWQHRREAFLRHCAL